MPIKVQVEVRSRRKLLGAMSDQELLQTLHAAIAASDDQRIALVENAAELSGSERRDGWDATRPNFPTKHAINPPRPQVERGDVSQPAPTPTRSDFGPQGS